MFIEEIEDLNSCIQDSRDNLVLIKGIHKIGKSAFIDQWVQNIERGNNYIIKTVSNNLSLNDIISKVNEDLYLLAVNRMGNITEPMNSDPILKFQGITNTICSINVTINIYIVLDEVRTFSSDDIERLKSLNVPVRVHIILLLSSRCGCKLDALSFHRIRIKCYNKDKIRNMYPTVPDDRLMKIHEICWGHFYFIERCLDYVNIHRDAPNNPTGVSLDVLLNNVLKLEMERAFGPIQLFFASSHYDITHFFKGISKGGLDRRSRVLLEIFGLFKRCNKDIDPTNGLFRGLEEENFLEVVKEELGDSNMKELMKLLKENEEFCKYLEMDQDQNCLKFYPPFIEALCKFIKDNYTPTENGNSLPECSCCD